VPEFIINGEEFFSEAINQQISFLIVDLFGVKLISIKNEVLFTDELYASTLVTVWQ